MSKRILVVEDQADNRQIIWDMLAPTGLTSSTMTARRSAAGKAGGQHINPKTTKALGI
jgi:CheY-like chemotaxis protein